MKGKGKSIEEISKMNLADLDRPNSGDHDYDDDNNDLVNPLQQVTDQGENNKEEAARSPETETGPAEEIAAEPAGETMAEPEGDHYEFEATIGKEELVAFQRYHMLHSVSVIAVFAMGLILPVFSWFFQRENMYLSFVFCFVLCIVSPILQYRNSIKQNMRNPIFKNVFHYMVDEKGFHLEAGLRAVDLEWKNIKKIQETENCYILYTNKRNAWILPKKDMGTSEKEIIQFINRMIKSQ